MKKTLIAAALTLASIASFADGLSLPGSNWSNLTYNPSPIKGTPEDNNILLQGYIEQGAVVGRIGPFRVNTYGALGYSVDRNGLSYNNKLVPQIGVKLQHGFGENGNLDLGVAVIHQDNFRGVTEGPKSGTGVQVYGQYWFGWNLGH